MVTAVQSTGVMPLDWEKYLSDEERLTKEYCEVTFKRLNFDLYPEQWLPLLCKKRIVFVTGGEQAGKSTVGAAKVTANWAQYKLVWLVGKDYGMCRTEFEMCANAFTKLRLLRTPDYPEKSISFPSEGPCSLILANGCKVVTKSLQDPIKIGQAAPDLIVICEIAQIEYDSYLRLLARSAPAHAQVFGTGTLEGSMGWYPEAVVYYQSGQEDGKSFSIPSWANRKLYPGGRDDPEIKRQEAILPRDLFFERFAAPMRPSGLVIQEFSNMVHVGDFDCKSGVPVDLAIDPGWAGACAVEVMQKWADIDAEVVIDEIYLTGRVQDEIIDIVMQKPWWGMVSGLYFDFAAKQHRTEGAVAKSSVAEIWKARTGLEGKMRQLQNEEDGVNLLRTMLKPHPRTGRPHLYVDKRCRGFIAECGGGIAPALKEDIPNVGPWLRDKETNRLIDRNNHATKAVIYRQISKYGWVEKVRRPPTPVATLG